MRRKLADGHKEFSDMPPLRICPGAVTVLVIALGCGPGRTPAERDDTRVRGEIAQALDRYMVAARAVDPDGIAASFTDTGVLFEPGITPIQSPDSIRAFVASFPGVQVESATAVPDTIEVFGATAYLWGAYYERLTFPGQPRSEQHGRFVIEWLRQPDGRWLIHRYFRVPVPSPVLGGTPPAP
jgi:uncharacterized protein (TIGR02246 family)